MDFHNCKWPSSVVKPLPQTETPDPSDAPSPEKAGGMRRVGSRNWLPTLDESGAVVKGSPRAMAGREKMLQKLWMSEAVDATGQVTTWSFPSLLPTLARSAAVVCCFCLVVLLGRRGACARQNDEMLERLLPRIRADVKADSSRSVVSFSHFQPRLDPLPQDRLGSRCEPGIPSELLSDQDAMRACWLVQELGRVCCSGNRADCGAWAPTCTCSATRTSTRTRPSTACATCSTRWYLTSGSTDLDRWGGLGRSRLAPGAQTPTSLVARAELTPRGAIGESGGGMGFERRLLPQVVPPTHVSQHTVLPTALALLASASASIDERSSRVLHEKHAPSRRTLQPSATPAPTHPPTATTYRAKRRPAHAGELRRCAPTAAIHLVFGFFVVRRPAPSGTRVDQDPMFGAGARLRRCTAPQARGQIASNTTLVHRHRQGNAAFRQGQALRLTVCRRDQYDGSTTVVF